MKWFKKNKEIERSFINWVFCNNQGWKLKYFFQVPYNPFLTAFINLCLYFDWFNNAGKFKPGDKVKYNFFSKVIIPGIEEIKRHKEGTIYTFIDYPEWSKSKSNCDYVDDNGKEGSCSVFWLTKI